MVEKSSLTTRARSIGSSGELAWGDDQNTWEDEADTTNNISFENGGIQPGVTVPDGGVARYPLSEDASDVWGGYDGTLNGVTFVDDADMGPVADFDGSSDITLPVLGFSGDTSVSIAVQYYVDSGGPAIDFLPRLKSWESPVVTTASAC